MLYGVIPFLPCTVGCLTGQNKNRPLHSGPYTEDFDFAIVDTPMHHALMHKSNFWSKIKSDLKPLEEHCVYLLMGGWTGKQVGGMAGGFVT